MSHDRAGPIVHVRENSDTELEALFNYAINPSAETNKPLPLRMRNLPASFFRPPEPPKQMQMGNKDSAEGYHGAANQLSMNIHMRAHSSPASLQQSLSAAPPPPPTSHVRQHSYDLLDEEALPSGWDMAKTPQGQRYYLNHALQITTWTDPRKTHITTTPPSSGNSIVSSSSNSNNNNNTNTSNLNSLGQAGSPSPAGPVSPVNIDKVPLPPGWERAYTADCEPYFINHIERTTSWFHPAIPPQLQKPGMKFQQQQQQQQSQQQQQQQVPSGPQDQLKQIKLQQLQMEQEILKKRQDEIARQEIALRAQVGGEGMGTPAQGETVSSNSEMTSVTDPFFGQTGSSDHHSRQESGDSGLGGMGTSYSLPRTPDDFLGNMEDMETQEGGPKLPGQTDFNSMDMAGVSDVTDTLTMDSDELEPSLQEEINSDLLKDMETMLVNKDNPLTWL